MVGTNSDESLMIHVCSHLECLEDRMRNDYIPADSLANLLSINDELRRVIRDDDMREAFPEDCGARNHLKIRELHLSASSLVPEMSIATKISTIADLLEDEEECAHFIKFLINSADYLENRPQI